MNIGQFQFLTELSLHDVVNVKEPVSIPKIEKEERIYECPTIPLLTQSEFQF